MNRKNQWRACAALAVAALAGAAGYVALRTPDAPLRAKLATLGIAPRPTVLGWPVSVSDIAGGRSAGFADGMGGAARFSDPYGLAIDHDGNLFVADAGDNNRIRKIAPDGAVSTLAGQAEGFADGIGAAAAFHTPSGLAIDKAGNLFVADTGNNAIRKVTPQGLVSTVAGTGVPGYRDGKANEAQFNGPVGVAVDKAGNLYVADTYNDRIRKIAVDGSVSTIAGSGAPGMLDGLGAVAQFDTPSALAVDAKGKLFIADTSNGAIRTLDTDGMVSTLAHMPETASPALLRRPVSLAVTRDGFLYVGDMGRGRIVQISPGGEVHGLTGIGIDVEIGDSKAVRFSRPSAIVLDRDGALYVADAVQRVVRKLAPKGAVKEAQPLPAPSALPAPVAQLASAKAANFPWPFAPQHGWHEVVGIVGEVRGSYDGEARDHFHNGLDVQADMGVPVLAVADEKVSSPLPNWTYGGLGEGMSIDAMAYIHMRVGRTIKNAPIDPARFTILHDAAGKPARVRIKRGTRFKVGDALGTVNRMFHVHLSYRPGGAEVNALTLPFSGYEDSIAPRIEGVELRGQMDKRLVGKRGKRLLVPRGAGPLSIVAEAYDQTNGNAARRKLGLYKAGYQILQADGTPVAGYELPRMNIEFNQLPPDQESVKVAYADKSGITVYGNARTRFLYVVTNKVRDGVAESGSWDPAGLAPGDYVIRVVAADYAGNEALGGRDLAITVE